MRAVAPKDLHDLADLGVAVEQRLALQHASHHAAGVPRVHGPVVGVAALTQEQLRRAVTQVVRDLTSAHKAGSNTGCTRSNKCTQGGQ